MAFVGHQGGNLTHGADYLTFKTLTEQKRISPAKIEDVLVFEDIIQPIFENKCTQCHQNGKKKGDLIMTSHAAILKGGKNGAVVVPNDLSKSELFKRITLDPKHKEFMPADGKPALSKNETEIIKWWIENGALGENQKFVSIKKHSEIKGQVAVLLGFVDGISIENVAENEKINPNIPKNIINDSVFITIEKGGYNIRKMKKQPLMLDISFAKNDVKPDLKLLEPIAKHIIWLNLSNSKLKDDDLKEISTFENIEKLRLEKNEIGDEGLKYLTKLAFLNSINLNFTDVTNKGIYQLKTLKNLRSIYSWNTKVDSVAVAFVLKKE